MQKLNITTMAFKIPTTHMHLHRIMTTLGSRPTTEAVIDSLSREPRIMLVE
jgi:glyceraldehyde-3-phosphate dehydrogenase/erythrose-4-phosphate dehydrogenase